MDEDSMEPGRRRVEADLPLRLPDVARPELPER